MWSWRRMRGVEELKRSLLGKSRAEALELVNQLEVVNPTPATCGCYWGITAFSELLPLLAAAYLKQLDASHVYLIVNSTTLSGRPFCYFLLSSASATFQFRTPSRIQACCNPPEINSSVELPENVDLSGQKIILVSHPSNLLEAASKINWKNHFWPDHRLSYSISRQPRQGTWHFLLPTLMVGSPNLKEGIRWTFFSPLFSFLLKKEALFLEL
ncbi:hypothetical protein NC651_008550 [Populus alba x Populus x berolinensis]|nr:hypothetical protein NC651_008550 [Populus alba x Populus x berolinensis]